MTTQIGSGYSTNGNAASGGREAAEQALATAGAADLVFVFASTNYGVAELLNAIRRVGGDVPLAGWETYGEIALTPKPSSGWHNSTTVLAVLPD